ncbi:MAG: alkaline phosphatase family protein [Sandaracinaceae bacterium]|nr:alkaline phosphatase family protein [Sandaracinaceae bacterium]
MRRMHGRPGDGGSDERRSIEELDAHLAAFRAASAPAFLIVHVTSTDSSAHAEGIASDAHQRALERADRAIARVAREVEGGVRARRPRPPRCRRPRGA